MKKSLFFLLWLILPLFCMAQRGLVRKYDYDASGNRILRKVINIQFAPPAPQYPTLSREEITNYEY